MDFYERKYREENEKREYLFRKMREITEAPNGTDLRAIAWEAVFHIYDEAFKVNAPEKTEEKVGEAA